MTLTDRSLCPVGPHAGIHMFKVPAKWLEDFASTPQTESEAHDAILKYIQDNRIRLDKILDAQEALT